MSWIYLGLGIIVEVIGSTSMKLSAGLTRLGPSITMFVCFGVSLAFATLAMKKLDLSLVYAIWAGLGTAMTAAIGIYWFKEPVSALKIASIFLIILGVAGLNWARTS